jgi:hypothetical protein
VATPAAAPINLLGSSGLSLALPILKRVAPVALVLAAIAAYFLTR